MLIRSGALDVIVIDSVAALVPCAEIEGEMGDSHVGLQARLMSQALRKITGALSNSGTTAIFINQLREKVGVVYGSPEVTTGGRALKFYSRSASTSAGSRPSSRAPTRSAAAPESRSSRTRSPRRSSRPSLDILLGPGLQPRGRTHRRRRRAGLRQEVRRLVHVRRRPARPGQGELPQLPEGQP